MEVCVDNIISALNAEKGGASRIELCSALSEGGLTPTPGFLKQVKKLLSIPIFCMIRARTGDFIYSDDEMETMIYDLKILKKEGADGFVFGALDENNDPHLGKNRDIIQNAGCLPVTFHRAFDEVRDPTSAIDTIVGLGFKRILTSGQKPTALEGIRLLEKLNQENRIIIMPGSGVNSDNLYEILSKTKAKEFHGSASKKQSNLKITDVDEVRKMVEIYKNM